MPICQSRAQFSAVPTIAGPPIGSVEKLSSIQCSTIGAPPCACGCGYITTGEFEVRSCATHSAAVPKPCSMSPATVASARALVAQACETTVPLTFGLPIIVISQGRP